MSDKEFVEDEILLTKINMGVSALFVIMCIATLIKICRGSRHPFFIKLIVLDLIGLILIELREASYIWAFRTSDGFKTD